jgi:peptidoglycan/LPS O-acetylase OafA/YrhL
MDIDSQGGSRPQLAAMDTPSKKEIFPGLDVVRFLAAVLVMIYHLSFWQNGHVPEAASFDWFWRFGWVGVEIFFTLSGFVIASSAQAATPAKFLVGRIVRLAPAVWICATLTLLASLTLAHGAVHPLLTNYARTIALVPVGDHIDIVYWTLTVEIAFYALVFAVLLVKDFETLLKVLIVVGLISTAFDLVLAFHAELSRFIPRICLATVTASSYHTSRLLLLRHGCFFALGMLLWTLGSGKRTWPQSYTVFLAIFVLGGTAEVWHEAQNQKISLAHPLSTASPVIAWLIGLGCIVASGLYSSGRKAGPVKTLRFVGLLTFPVYLLHNNIGLLILNKLAGGDSRATGMIVVTVLLVLSAATVITLFVEPPVANALRQTLRRLSARVVGAAPELNEPLQAKVQ